MPPRAKRAAIRIHPLAQTGKPDIRAAKSRRNIVRKLGIVQHDVVLQRGVAEQHVDELTGVVAGRGAAQADSDREQAGRNLADILHPADDVVEDVLVLDRRKRHLDALLDRDGTGAAFDRTRIRADVINGDEAGHGFSLEM